MISGALARLHIEVIVVSPWSTSAAASTSTWATSASSSSTTFGGRSIGVTTGAGGTVSIGGLVIGFLGIGGGGILGWWVVSVEALDSTMALLVLFAGAPLRFLVFGLFGILVGRFLAFARG